MGEWKFENKEKQIEVKYTGEWENSIWHGLGDLYETSGKKNLKISLEISKGRFMKGFLILLLPILNFANLIYY